MRELVGRHPRRSAVVVWLALFVITRGTTSAAATVRERSWPAYVLLAFAVYAAFAIWLSARKLKAPGRPTLELLLALSVSPTIIGSGLAFQGAPAWSLWTACIVSGGLLVLSLLIVTQEPDGPVES